jgi:nucleotide-binding universal stress UspA family protein
VPTRILLATDFSGVSAEAARRALESAARDHAVLGVCHVASGQAPSTAQIKTWLANHLPDSVELDPLVRGAAESHAAPPSIGAVRVEAFVDEGPPYAAIVERAQAFAADLVVVGSHGRTGLARLLLGSVAESVVRQATCPVLVVRPGPAAGPIVAATDLSAASKPGLRAAAIEAARAGSELHAIHVFELVGPGVTYAVDTSGTSASLGDTDALHRANEELLAAAAEATRGLPVEARCEVHAGEPATVIARRAEELSARLVAVSTHGRTGLERVLLGSVAERIVRLSPTSVLAVRATADQST